MFCSALLTYPIQGQVEMTPDQKFQQVNVSTGEVNRMDKCHHSIFLFEMHNNLIYSDLQGKIDIRFDIRCLLFGKINFRVKQMSGIFKRLNGFF